MTYVSLKARLHQTATLWRHRRCHGGLQNIRGRRRTAMNLIFHYFFVNDTVFGRHSGGITAVTRPHQCGGVARQPTLLRWRGERAAVCWRPCGGSVATFAVIIRLYCRYDACMASVRRFYDDYTASLLTFCRGIKVCVSITISMNVHIWMLIYCTFLKTYRGMSNILSIYIISYI